MSLVCLQFATSLLLVCHEFATYYWSNFRDAPSSSRIDRIIIYLISADNRFFVIKLPLISESYRFGFIMKINGNFATDKVTVYRFKTTVFVAKLRFLGERYRCDETNRLSRYKITVLLVSYHYI